MRYLHTYMVNMTTTYMYRGPTLFTFVSTTKAQFQAQKYKSVIESIYFVFPFLYSHMYLLNVVALRALSDRGFQIFWPLNLS